MVWYLRGPDGVQTLPTFEGREVGLPREADVVDSNYFAGLLPNRTAGIVAGGPAKFVAVYVQWRQKLEGFEPVWLGTLSDHCMPVAASDDTLLFSIKLSDRVALQALVERGEKVEDYSVEYYGEGDPLLPKDILKTLGKKDKKVREAVAARLRTVKLPWDGTVLHDGPRLDYSDYSAWNLDRFDDRPDSPLAVSVVAPFNMNGVAFVARDGSFPAVVARPCKDHELAVWTTRTEDGRMRVRFTGRDDRLAECNRDEAERVERILNDAERGAPARTGGRD